MRNRTEWEDHVLSQTGLFKVVADATVGVDDVYSISPFGEVMQQGTMQDAWHFNNIEDSLDAHETAINMLIAAYLFSGETDERKLEETNLALSLVMNGMRTGHWQNEDRLNVHDTQIAALDAQTTELYRCDVISKSFTNSANYPFNNSKASVALLNNRENTNYIVIPEVTAFNGNVGEVVITEKLTNGFKAEYTGSAASATIKFTVIGGYNK